jgi:hypothetical protein
MGKSTISMAIFNSYFDITRGISGPTRSVQTTERGCPGKNKGPTSTCLQLDGGDTPLAQAIPSGYVKRAMENGHL